MVLAGIALPTAISLRSYFQRAVPDGSIEGSALLGRGLRGWYFEQLAPIEDWCVARGIAPATLTLSQLPGALLAGTAYACGLLSVGGWLVLALGSLDIIDGRLARRTTGGTPQGAFLDSVVDRYADTLCLSGLAIHYRHSWLLGVVLLALLGSSMVSYTRARAEALGVECRAGLFQRPERTVLLGLGSVVAVLAHHLQQRAGDPGHHPILLLVLVTLAIGTNVSAWQRFRQADAALSGGPR